MNKTKTAKELGIHINTVKYRLTQIELTTGLNLSNMDKVLGSMLSLKVQDLYRVLSENTALMNW
ncbi:MAG: helix-turn-helix domain-containing protein [Oscillospiraceae bacterium]|nr:helix-turn-helix domain-containing protein [Oscillospiraceae bacterium]